MSSEWDTLPYLKQISICNNILILFQHAVANKWEGNVAVLRHMFIQAKKMNRKLYEYKYGTLPTLEKNSWNEEDWIAQLDKLEKETICRVES